MNKILNKQRMMWLPNLALTVALVILVRNGLEVLAFLLIAISKWQVLIGGYRLWLSNIRENACDLIVAFSSLILLILYSNDLSLQIAIASLYFLWLTAVKPLTGMGWHGVQAAVCQFSGLSVIFLFGRLLPLAGVIVLSWLVALVAAEHFLTDDKDKSAPLVLIFVWALLVGQLAWLFGRWLVVYSFLDGRVLLPQAPLVITIIGYMFGNMYIDHISKSLQKKRLFGYVGMSLMLFVAIILGTEWSARL